MSYFMLHVFIWTLCSPARFTGKTDICVAIVYSGGVKHDEGNNKYRHIYFPSFLCLNGTRLVKYFNQNLNKYRDRICNYQIIFAFGWEQRKCDIYHVFISRAEYNGNTDTILHYIMKRKAKQWWSTISSTSTKWKTNNPPEIVECEYRPRHMA
jgi:hypothetical protein